MMRSGGFGVRRGRVLLGLVIAGALMALPAASAQAVHLFPLTPVFDPLTHDCAKNLEPGDHSSAGNVLVAGFNFIDAESMSPVTTIAAGESVTWTWLLDHCHSVTFSPERGTQGAAGFQPAQPELVRMGDEGGHHFSLTFEEPGTYDYLCVHHESLGMQGTVVVTPPS